MFGDLLMMRYCAPDPNSLVAEIRAPTVSAGSFTEAVRAYAGLIPADANPAAAGWRLHDSVALATPEDYFFAIASGGTGRNKRWKRGGDFYARAGLQNRVTGGSFGALDGCIAGYEDLGEDHWRLTFKPGYVQAAFSDLLKSEPIPFWSFAFWMLRTVRIPDNVERDDAMNWIRNTVMREARLDATHAAANREEAVNNSAWFYLGETPDPDDYLAADPLSGDELRQVCMEFDENANVAPEAARAPAGQQVELDARLLDAGDGRRLIVDSQTVTACLTHLARGRHLLLVGPPGTGKSTLAANLARAAADEALAGIESPSGHVQVTASSTWTTFDTLGGYIPTREGNLVFRPGVFLRAFESDAWLVIDELNRADADKAFGPFIGVLGGARETQELPFEMVVDDDGTVVPVRLVSDPDETAKEADYVVPEGWRVIATMNTYDKNSLFRLSYAFLRRFAFVYVGTLDVDTTIEAATQSTSLSEEDETRLTSIVQLCEAERRPLGVAIVADVAGYVERAREFGDVTEPFLDAVVAHVLPQLDALEPDAVKRIFEGLLAKRIVAEGARPRLEEVFRQMLDYRG